MKRANKVGRPKKKANGILLKFLPAVEQYLRKESQRTDKTMVRIVEEMLEYRARFKSWPPESKSA
jgi:hypothetical protein